MSLTIVRFINILLAAILAGTSFGIWMGFDPAGFSYPTYLEQQQNTIRSLNTLMIALVISATLVTLVSALLQRKNKITFIILLLAALSFIACILISKFGNGPLNLSILSWNSKPPENWISIRNSWWSYHIYRTIAELFALVLVAWASVRKGLYIV